MEVRTLAVHPQAHSRSLILGLWTAQAFIAIAFCLGGVMKLAMPIPQLADMWPWTGDIPPSLVRSLGVIDLLGGLGILLPSLTRIKPGLTVLAAAGCIALQLSAIIFHSSRAEFSALPVNAVLIAGAIFILWGRWKKIPINHRPA